MPKKKSDSNRPKVHNHHRYYDHLAKRQSMPRSSISRFVPRKRSIVNLRMPESHDAEIDSIKKEEETINLEDSDLVFVITSFDPSMEPIFEGIMAAAERAGLTAKRVKDVVGDYCITTKIMTMIANARFIVADLTQERPNVYFELGYARGLGKTVITCAREGTRIHFDVNDWPYLSYNDSRVLEKQLCDRFFYELERDAKPANPPDG